MTFDEALAKITKNKDMKTLWENSYIYLDWWDSDYAYELTPGLLLVFLLRKDIDVVECLGKQGYYNLLKEILRYVYNEDPNLLGAVYDSSLKETVSPFKSAVGSQNATVVNMFLKFLPIKFLNQVEEIDFGSSRPVHSLLAYSIVMRDLDVSVVYKLIDKVTNLDVLEEASKLVAPGRDKDQLAVHYLGRMESDKIYKRIRDRIEAVKNPKHSWGASIVSIFTRKGPESEKKTLAY